jgi:hypothetical protein
MPTSGPNRYRQTRRLTRSLPVGTFPGTGTCEV